MRYRFFVLCIVVLNVIPALSQARRHWQLTLSDGEVFSKVQLNDMKDNLLIFSDSTGNRTVFIDSIVELRFVREGKLWKGAMTGTIVGLVVGVVGGAVFSTPSEGKNEIFKPEDQRILSAIGWGIGLGVVGGLIGGTGGAISGIDSIYDLSSVPLNRKSAFIHMIIAREKNE
jgi:hypothetical protein